MDLYSAYLRLFFYFPLVLFLIFFILRFVLRRMGAGQIHKSQLQVVERCAVSPRTFLLVVRVGDEYLLLASGAQGVTLLKDLGSSWRELPAENENFVTPDRLFQVFKECSKKQKIVGYLHRLTNKILYCVKKNKKRQKFEEEFDDLTRKLLKERKLSPENISREKIEILKNPVGQSFAETLRRETESRSREQEQEKET